MVSQVTPEEPLPWSQEIEQWLPGFEHDRNDYDIPCNPEVYEWQSHGTICTVCGNA